jgi:predicted AlkP superfamily pyrophosphatase or phosphodiesterase
MHSFSKPSTMKTHSPPRLLPCHQWLLASCLLASTIASTIASTLPALAATPPQTAPVRPKLVVVLVVDGLPNEQVLRYRDQFSGGFKRFLQHGSHFSDAHQAHGITVTAVGHAAILTGAYPYQHGVIGNEWIDAKSKKSVYCTQDNSHRYLGNEETKENSGTSPANLRVSTLGDELRYATGGQARVVAISGKDRGAILLAGKTGTAYMYQDKSGNFTSSSYYMKSHPQWVQKFQSTKPQDQFFGKPWCLVHPESAYAQDTPGTALVSHPACKYQAFEGTYRGNGDKPDSKYYAAIKAGPYVDQLSLNFARAAIEGENLGKNPAGVPDLLGVSLSSHDYVNHELGPESRESHDHLQHLDLMLGNFFTYLDKRIGLDNTLILLTADHGFPNTPEFAGANKFDAQRIKGKAMVAALNQHLAQKFNVENLLAASSAPNFWLDQARIEQKNLSQPDVENSAARFLMDYDGVSNVFTRTQLETGNLPQTRMGNLMQRAWHRQVSGDLMVVTKPYWFFSNSTSGTTHGSPYSYDTNVPILVLGKKWIKPGNYGNYVEVVDIAPTLAHLLQLRPPSGSEGRVLTEAVR